jgi:hypothetical protein
MACPKYVQSPMAQIYFTRLNLRCMRSTMVAKASLAFFRSDLPNRAPLTSQLVSYFDFGVSRSMMAATKCSQSGPDFLTASVIADSNVIFEIDCLIEDFTINPTPQIVKRWPHAGARTLAPTSQTYPLVTSSQYRHLLQVCLRIMVARLGYPRVQVWMKESKTQIDGSALSGKFVDGCYQLLLHNQNRLFLLRPIKDAASADLPVAIASWEGLSSCVSFLIFRAANKPSTGQPIHIRRLTEIRPRFAYFFSGTSQRAISLTSRQKFDCGNIIYELQVMMAGIRPSERHCLGPYWGSPVALFNLLNKLNVLANMEESNPAYGAPLGGLLRLRC